MMIRTAWVEIESGFELVAAANDDDYFGVWFDLEVDRKTFEYDMEPLVLCLDVDDSLIAELFADDAAV